VAKRKWQSAFYVCGPGEIGPQCGYVSYMASMEYGPKRVPMHVHRDTSGNWLETAWGPAKACQYPQQVKHEAQS
jgi:hypothetical protein